ncbi:MAG: hypothetical protein U0411_07770 [Thermodesulfovibrionales bacterium]
MSKKSTLHESTISNTLPNETAPAADHSGIAEWIGSIAERISGARAVTIIAFLVMLVTVLGYFPTRSDDYDIWWHLALGKHYVQHHTMRVDHSIFSWTPADPGWIYNTWLGSTLLYLFYQAGSGFGLWVIQWLLLGGVFFLLYRYTRIVKDSFDINNILVFLMLAVSLNLTAIYVKPELFTTFLFTLSVFLYFYCKATGKNLFFLYPLLFVLWCNIHGGFLAGLLFISVVLAGETLNFFFLKNSSLPKKAFKTLAAAVPLSYLAVLINPYGIEYHISVLKGMFDPAYMGFAKRVFAYISMWKYLLPTSDFAFRFLNTAWVLLIFAVLFAVLLILSAARKRSLDAAVLASNMVFFFFSMDSARYTIFFPIVTLFSIFYFFKDADLYAFKKKLTPLSIVFFVVFVIYINYLTVAYLDDWKWFGKDLQSRVPVKEAEFLKKYKIQGPLFNDYLIGGYMIWSTYPEYKVFIDPRYGPFWKQVGPDYFTFTSNITPETLKAFNGKYPFKAALVHMNYSNMIFAMAATGDWRLLYFDKVAVLMVHKSLIPTLSAEALATDLTPQRFKDVSNPTTLRDLFNFYNAVGPQFGRQVYEIFKKNVHDFYKFKEQSLQVMEQNIRLKEQQIQQLQQQQKPRKQ